MLSVLTRSGMVSGTTSDKKNRGSQTRHQVLSFFIHTVLFATEQGKTYEYLITWRILYELIASTWLQAVSSIRSSLGKKNLKILKIVIESGTAF
jgi:hypothetical protein